MSDNNNNQDVQVETTSVFRADLLKEMESGAAAPATGSDITPPAGAAILIVKRGPNAGARFLLDQETTTAGRHPESDIFLDDVTVSRRHAEFRLNDGTFEVVDPSTAPMSIGNLATHRCYLLVMRSKSVSSD